MSRKFFEIVRITRGFFKDQIGIVVDKSPSHARFDGRDPEEVYQVMIKTGGKIIDVDDKDLRHEDLPEEKDAATETEEDIENAGENPEEGAEEEKENK